MKSGLSTLKIISGLNLTISFGKTFFLYLKNIQNNTGKTDIISFKSKIDLIPNLERFDPPTEGNQFYHYID